MNNPPIRMHRYMEALAQIQPSHAHEIRGQVGNLILQIGLFSEFLRRDLSDPVFQGKLKETSIRAEKAAREVERSMDRLLDQTSHGKPAVVLDVAEVLQKVGDQLSSFLKLRQVEWGLAVPDLPVIMDHDRDSLQQSLLVACLEVVKAAPKLGRVDLRLEPDGTLVMPGTPDEWWVAFLKDEIGAEPKVAEDDPSVLHLRLPVRTPAPGGGKCLTP